MLNDDLREAALCATPGPWRDDWDEADWWWVIYGPPHGEYLSPEVATTDSRDGADARFIALANPQRILALLDERDALAEAVERVRAIHKPARVYALADECGCGNEDHVIIESPMGEDLCWDSPTGDTYCPACTPEYGADELTDWPCEYIRALDGGADS